MKPWLKSLGQVCPLLSDPEFQLIEQMNMRNGDVAYRGYALMDEKGNLVFKTVNDHYGEEIDQTIKEIKGRILKITGKVIFYMTFIHFDFKEPNVSEIDLDLTQAHLWDDSAVSAIDKIVTKYQQNGIKVNLIGLDHESGKLIHQLSVHLKKDELVTVVNKIG